MTNPDQTAQPHNEVALPTPFLSSRVAKQIGSATPQLNFSTLLDHGRRTVGRWPWIVP